MKENKYDDEIFFEKYSHMLRSERGLAGAGEWPALQKLLPPLEGKRMLDLGCGFGWHCIYAAEHGASQVLGTDLSEKMLEIARQKTRSSLVRYERCAMEELHAAPASFDLVLSSLALHYVADYAALVRRVYDWLSPGGDFVFSVEHPIFTASGPQDWYYGENGEKLHYPVDRYFDQGRREAQFLGETVTKYHRTLTTYLGALLEAGFSLRGVTEPQPPAELLDEPGMRDELRRPMMLLIAARKN